MIAQLVKNLPAMQETWVQSLGWEDHLEKGSTTPSGLEDSMDCMVHGIAKSQIRLSDFHSLTPEAQKASPRLWREGASCSPTV